VRKENKNLNIASIDIPSGWDVNEGQKSSNFIPDMNISLTLPKLGLLGYNGLHYIGGRFVPYKLCKEMNLKIPKYHKSEMINKLDVIKISF